MAVWISDKGPSVVQIKLRPENSVCSDVTDNINRATDRQGRITISSSPPVALRLKLIKAGFFSVKTFTSCCGPLTTKSKRRHMRRSQIWHWCIYQREVGWRCFWLLCLLWHLIDPSLSFIRVFPSMKINPSASVVQPNASYKFNRLEWDWWVLSCIQACLSVGGTDFQV